MSNSPFFCVVHGTTILKNSQGIWKFWSLNAARELLKTNTAATLERFTSKAQAQETKPGIVWPE